MLPADDIIINILLCGTVASLYGAAIRFLIPILLDCEVVIQLIEMRKEIQREVRRENESADCGWFYGKK